MSKKVSMREAMPVTAAWIDKMREIFGGEAVDSAIRRGMRGQQGFHVVEGGHEVGTPVYRGEPLDWTPEPYARRMGEVVWEEALDWQTLENEKG